MLGEFNLEGIPPARRGTPQIEVTLDIDANGIMHVTAKDKGTGKENKITIKSNSGLSDAEVERMISEAEANAESDKQQRTLIETRNRSESLIYELEKEYSELKDKLTDEEKTTVDTALEEAKKASKETDVEVIQKSFEKIYNALGLMQSKKQAEQNPAKQDDNVVDAEFKETV
jgi:molecular chaperone DnaK